MYVPMWRAKRRRLNVHCTNAHNKRSRESWQKHNVFLFYYYIFLLLSMRMMTHARPLNKEKIWTMCVQRFLCTLRCIFHFDKFFSTELMTSISFVYLRAWFKWLNWNSFGLVWWKWIRWNEVFACWIFFVEKKERIISHIAPKGKRLDLLNAYFRLDVRAQSSNVEHVCTLWQECCLATKWQAENPSEIPKCHATHDYSKSK